MGLKHSKSQIGDGEALSASQNKTFMTDQRVNKFTNIIFELSTRGCIPPWSGKQESKGNATITRDHHKGKVTRIEWTPLITPSGRSKDSLEASGHERGIENNANHKTSSQKLQREETLSPHSCVEFLEKK